MIRYIEGVPRWFTWLWHKVVVQRCHRIGHVGPVIQGGTCVRCGYIFEHDGYDRRDTP